MKKNISKNKLITENKLLELQINNSYDKKFHLKLIYGLIDRFSKLSNTIVIVHFSLMSLLFAAYGWLVIHKIHTLYLVFVFIVFLMLSILFIYLSSKYLILEHKARNFYNKVNNKSQYWNYNLGDFIKEKYLRPKILNSFIIKWQFPVIIINIILFIIIVTY